MVLSTTTRFALLAALVVAALLAVGVYSAPWHYSAVEEEADVTRSLSAEPDVVFADTFPGGRPELRWRAFPFFNGDNLEGAPDPAAPDGDDGVGVLTNDRVGGFAALAYVDAPPVADYRLETWLRAQVIEGERRPLNGIVFGVDPEGGRYYRVAADFSGENPLLSLAYVGKDTNNFPVYLVRWRAEDLPGGAPRETGWHRLAIEVVDGRGEVYWEGEKLPGGPFEVDRVREGQVGVYATTTGGLGQAETAVDGFVVRRLSGQRTNTLTAQR
jgi:hypothetical protein